MWNILSDGGFALIVANAAHIKNVPGRKTDLNDAMWIADLLACGLIKASFVPPEDLQELRSLLRTRKQLVREQTSHVQRIQKTLEEANIKLDAVISDILGASGRRMIEAIIAGVRDPRQLAGLADRRLKATPKQLYDALHGRVRDHHRFLLQLHLAQWGALDAAIRAVDREADARIAELDDEEDAGQAPFCEMIARLSMMPGVSVLAARTIVAEIGRDMSRFPTAGHLVLGGSVSRPERERRQEEIDPIAQGRPMAEDDAGAMRLGGQAQEGQLLPGSVLPAAKPARAAKSHLRRRRLAPHRHLSHGQERHPPPRPRRCPLRSPFLRSPSPAPARAARQARLPGPAAARGSLRCHTIHTIHLVSC